MSFLYPYVLLALALPLLLAALGFVAHHRRNRDWRKLVSAEHEAELVRRRAPWRSLLPPMLGLLALAGCIIAAARPINGYSDSGMSVSGRNLLIALDLSRSMETRDVTPSRLEEARAAAYELIDALPNDKIGLILFAGQADLIVPLTYDHTALRDTLAQVNRDWAGYGGTNFGSVLKCAMSTFERNAPGSSNALVILSDGEDTVSNTEGLAEEARKQRMLVITVGIGTPQGDTIPDPSADDGLYTDAQGKHVISKLNAESLQRFAEATGGSFFLMNNGANLTDFARQAVAKIDTHEETTASGKTPRDLFAYVAAASLLLLIASIITGTDWRRARGMRSLSSFGAALLLLLGGAAGNADAAPDEGSVKAFRRGLELQSEKPEEARQAFSEALLDEDPAMQAAATYQLSQMDAQGVLDHLRRLYGEPTEDQAEEGIAPADKPKPSQPTPEDLRGIIDDLRAPMDGYRQALKDDPELTEAGTNVAKLETLVRNLEAEIKRLSRASRTNRISRISKASRTNKISRTSKDSRTNRISRISKDSRTNRISRTSKASRTNRINRTSKASRTNRINRTSKASRTNRISRTSKASRTNKISKTSRANRISKASRVSRINKTSRVSRTSKISRTTRPAPTTARPKSKPTKSRKPVSASNNSKSSRRARMR